MTELNIRPLPVADQYESFVPLDDSPFIDENVVRQMILDGNPDNLPATGNPSLPQTQGRGFSLHPLAFAS